MGAHEKKKTTTNTPQQLKTMNKTTETLQVLQINHHGIQVEHIPGGCTSLCQPVDIGINKPFKAFLRKAWEKWMIDEGIRSGTTSPPTRELIAKWASYAKEQIKETHIRNAWRHEPFSWFPTSVTPFYRCLGYVLVVLNLSVPKILIS